jgi:hypothetical protein
MNAKLKIALLTMLGFSTAACCGTKKASKNKDAEPQKIEADSVDTRIMLMYGVPFPDGSIARPVDENGNPLPPARNGAKSEGAKFPDGRVAIPVDEDGKELVDANAKEALHDEESDKADMVLE